MNQFVFDTQRLVIRLAAVEDVPLFYQLWTHPRVMTYVGFPQGLPITQAEIEEKIAKQGIELFDHLLVVMLKTTEEASPNQIAAFQRCLLFS